MYPTSVMNGARLHSINPSCGVTLISPPSVWQVLLRCLSGPGQYPCLWTQVFLSIAGTMSDSVHSEKSSRRASPTYASLELVQNLLVSEVHSNDLYHLL